MIMEDPTKLKEELDQAKARIKELQMEIAKKNQIIEGLEAKLGELQEVAQKASAPEPLTDIDISPEEDFIIKRLKENNNKMNYRAVQTACEERFEGVRLVLKKLKEKGVVDYEGIIPSFDGDITLLREP